MAKPDRANPRLILIGLAVVLMSATIYVVGNGIRGERGEARLLPAGDQEAPSASIEGGISRRSDKTPDYVDAPESNPNPRTLARFYARRSYPGAPPFIPHPVKEPQGVDSSRCNLCHLNGGWVADFKAYAPLTPHPELANCRQCHVKQDEKPTFQATQFVAYEPPKVKQAALPGSPPPIPHPLEMRANCVACHGGPAAVAEVRTKHPERANCRQCHAGTASGVTSPVFERRLEESQ